MLVHCLARKSLNMHCCEQRVGITRVVSSIVHCGPVSPQIHDQENNRVHRRSCKPGITSSGVS